MAKQGDSARDRAGIGPHLRPGVKLVPLRKHASLSIVDGEPDIRGWDVRTVSGREIGKVDDLLVDSSVNEVVMLQIDLPGTDRHTLAPIRAAHLDRGRRVVMLDSEELRDERDIPSLARDGEITEEEVRLFGERYERAYGRDVAQDTRERGAADTIADRGSSVRYAGSAAEETVVESRPVVVEEVIVRRRVVDAGSADAASAGEAGLRPRDGEGRPGL
jgi:hypothetical protein